MNMANNFIGFNKKTMSEYRDGENQDKESSKYSDREIDNVGENDNDIMLEPELDQPISA